jgi:large subunit ribosomal protein L25
LQPKIRTFAARFGKVAERLIHSKPTSFMKSLEIVGFKRANLGKTDAKALRLDAQVPCVLYGGQDTVHFSVPAILFRELLYTPEAHIVDLNVEGTTYRAIVQDAQFHPVNEMLLHVDFLEIQDGKEVKMDIPVKYVGVSPGVLAGGKLASKLRKLKVKATAELHHPHQRTSSHRDHHHPACAERRNGRQPLVIAIEAAFANVTSCLNQQ